MQQTADAQTFPSAETFSAGKKQGSLGIGETGAIHVAEILWESP